MAASTRASSRFRRLHREVLEETGWRMAPVRRLGAYRRFTFMPDYDRWAEKLCHVHLARPTIAVGPPTEPGHSAVWMPLATAAERLDPRVGQAFVGALARGRLRV